MKPELYDTIPAPAAPAAGILPPVLTPLPLGAVAPRGWLAEQFRLTVNGFFSHMEDISAYMSRKNGWLVPDAPADPENYARTAWEEQAYWLRGAYKLALVTGDEKLSRISEDYFRAMFASAKPDGWFGPDCLRSTRHRDGAVPDVWPHFVMAEALSDRWRTTGDRRAFDLLYNFFRFCADLPEESFMLPRDGYERWQGMIQIDRCCDALPVVHDVYRETGDEKLLALCGRLIAVWRREDPERIDCHVVNFAERFRYSAERYPVSRDPADVEESRRMFEDHMAKWGQMPGGLWAADENVREGKTDPRQGTETCAMSEIVKSFTYMATLTGEPVWADRSERIMFNSYPASHDPDYTALHYLTANNQTVLDARDHDYDNKGMMTRYTAFGYRCCQHNTGMAWPNFIASSFAKTEDALVALSLCPAEADADLGSNRVRVAEETDYPFGNAVTFRVTAERPFDFFIRVPGWAKNATLAAGGEKYPVAPGFVRVRAKDGDTLTLDPGAEVRFERWRLNNDCVSVSLGALDFSLKLEERWTVADMRTDLSGNVWPARDVEAVDPVFPALDLSAPVEVRRRAVEGNPFTPRNAPVELTARGFRTRDWGVGEEGTPDPVPPSPPATVGGELELTLIPQGAARVRLSCFPHV